MARSARRLALLAGITGLALVALPLGDASANRLALSSSPPPPIGDNCLIGTWQAGRGVASTLYRGETVRMHFRGGDIDHISGSGVDHDNWKHAKPAVGRLHGHNLVEQVRGVNRTRLRAARHHGTHTLSVTERGWSRSSTNRFVYRGKHSRGYLRQSGTSTVNYRCTARKLTLRRHGKVIERETRLSRKP
jgi:hypothetical protein